MAVLTLHGGVTYNLAEVGENIASASQTFRDKFVKNKCGDYSWTDNTKLLANFNRNISGSNFGGDFGNIIKFVIFKTIGRQTRLHKVCETVNSLQRVIEDFTVGDLCDYQYYVFAVCNNTIDVNGTQVSVEGITPIISKTVNIHSGIVSVIGLKEAGNNVYTIDENNVWHIQYNLRDDGYTLNTDKTFHQTQHAYGKETAGNRKQRSVPISGLLGNVNCPDGKFVDDFDYIIEWENFAASSTPKMLIDVRGIITIGDMNKRLTMRCPYRLRLRRRTALMMWTCWVAHCLSIRCIILILQRRRTAY